MRDVSNKRCRVRSGTSTVGVEGGEDARARQEQEQRRSGDVLELEVELPNRA